MVFRDSEAERHQEGGEGVDEEEAVPPAASDDAARALLRVQRRHRRGAEDVQRLVGHALDLRRRYLVDHAVLTSTVTNSNPLLAVCDLPSVNLGDPRHSCRVARYPLCFLKVRNMLSCARAPA